MRQLLHSLTMCVFPSLICVRQMSISFEEIMTFSLGFVLVHCMVQEGMSAHVAAGCFCKCMLVLHELLLKAVLALSIA